MGNKSQISLIKNKNGVQQQGNNTDICLFCDADIGSKLCGGKHGKGVYQRIEALHEENTRNCKTKTFQSVSVRAQQKDRTTLGSPHG